MPLTDFLLAIPEIYSPPSDLSKRRNDALRTLVINRSLSDIDELIAARHWRNVVDRTPQYSSDLTLAVLDLKRNSSDGDGKFSNSMMVIHGGAGDGGFKPIGLVKKRSIWSVWEYMTYLSGWIFQLMLLVLWAKYTGPKIARHFPPDIQHRIRIVTTPIDHCLNTGLRLLWEYTIGNEQLLQNASELTRRVGQGIIKDGSKYLRDLERRTYRVGEHMTDSLAALGDIAGDTAKALPASGVTLGGEVKQKFGDAVEMGMKLAAGSRPEWGNGKWEGLMDGWDEYGYRYGNWGGYGDYDGDYGERDDDDEYTYDGEYDRNYDTNYGGQYNEQY